MASAIVSMLNLKGGAGKTLVSASLASQWATYEVEEEGRRRPLRVLGVDMDPQASLLEWNGRHGEDGPVVPVVGLTAENLRSAIKRLAPNYDVVVIDTPPRLSEAAVVSLMVCSVVVVPVSPGATDLWAMEPTLAAIRNARLQREFSIFGVLNKADRRLYTNAMAKEVTDMGLVLLDARLRNYDDHPSAMAEGASAIEFAPKSNAAHDVRRLASELGAHMGIA